MRKRFTDFIGTAMTLGLTGLMLGGIAALVLLHHYSSNLPDYRQLSDYDPATVTRLYAADGQLLEEYAVEKRIFVPLHAIPKRVIQAFLSAEDKNFFEHTGVDIYGIGRAIVTNFYNLGHNRSLVGGSTITQQVVKNFLLTNEKSLERKIKEAILAFRISKVYSKERILELYLNEIYLGLGSYGIAAASLNYFNKPLEELSLEEIALLAGLPKAPANYDPRKYYMAAKNRRDYVLTRMQEDGHITPQEASLAKEQEITLHQREETALTKADFFAEEVRRQLISTYGYDKVYKGGLFVRTTLDPKLQDMADRALRYALVEYDKRHGYRGPLEHFTSLEGWRDKLESLPSGKIPLHHGQRLAVVTETGHQEARIRFMDGAEGYIPLGDVKWASRRGGGAVASITEVFQVGDVIIAESASGETGAERGAYSLVQIPEVNGALLAMDPHTGRILAMSGGYSPVGTEFNRATQARRQPGSAFKPFVYLAGLESGLSPATIIVDGPIEIEQGEGLPVWRPQNYSDDFLGPTTLRRGIEKSRNAMTVRLAQIVGIDKIIDIARRFGIYEELPKQFSIVLGSYETTLMKLASAYAMLAAGGKEVTPTIIERVDDKHGNIIYRRDNRLCEECLEPADANARHPRPPEPQDNRDQLVDPRTAYQMVYMMQGVVERGTGIRAKQVGHTLAGKTGTTNDSRDTWFVGFSPDLVAGIYVGYDTPRSLGSKETGSNVALPGFVKFMSEALADTPSTPFRVPPGIRMVKINPNTGLPPYVGDDSVIWEAFKTGEEPGEENNNFLYSDWQDDNTPQTTYESGVQLPWQGQEVPASGYNYTNGAAEQRGYTLPQSRYTNSQNPAMAPARANPSAGADSSWQAPPTLERHPPLRAVPPSPAQPGGRSGTDMGTGGLY